MNCSYYFNFTGQTVPPTASNRAPSLAPIGKALLVPTQHAFVRLSPTLSTDTGEAPKNVVRINLAFDTQQARVVVTPEDTLQGRFVGVSLLTIRRAWMKHFGGGSKVMELVRFWRDGLEVLVLTSLM